MNKSMMWGLVVIALLVGAFGGYYYEKTKLEGQMMMLQASMQKQADNSQMMKKDEETEKTTMMQPSATAMTMMGNNAKLGSYLTDSKGMALYTFDKDTTGVSNCTGQCATIWPPFMAKDPVPSPLPDHMTTIKRDDGSMQYAWDGKPLYYYMKDKDKEDVYGDGVGGIWHIVK